jgi:2-polyprenyl-3-methyl-5-hydroxy-6-metoxy-1,4-benzoquinol methylase
LRLLGKNQGKEAMRQMSESTGDILNALTLPDAAKQRALVRKALCLLCGSAMEVALTDVTDNRLGTPGAYEIHRCVRCGFEQIFPVPSLEELKELYETHYNFGGERNTLYTRWRERFFFSFLYRLWMRLDGDAAFYRQRGTGRLLDVGCNEGRGLRIYARNGFQAEGLDLNEAAAAVAREAGFNVHTCLLEEFNPVIPYDVAVLSNVLEHSLDPGKMLLDVREILANGGQVWVSCPNSESWLRRVFGRSWINWHVPFHISHFSSRTLDKLFAETGYTRIEVRQITPAVWVAHSVITYLFAKKGKKNTQLRNPFLSLILMMFARFVLFPVLWVGNRSGHGDCLVAVATKA